MRAIASGWRMLANGPHCGEPVERAGQHFEPAGHTISMFVVSHVGRASFGLGVHR
jgi:hypothetical protein